MCFKEGNPQCQELLVSAVSGLEASSFPLLPAGLNRAGCRSQSLLGSLRKQKAQVCCRPHCHHHLLLLFPFVRAGD